MNTFLNKQINEINELSYNEKYIVYTKFFSLGCFASEELNDKLALISLLALVTYQVKKKNTEITPLKILMDITKQKPDDSVYYQMLEALSIITEDFMYGCSKFDSFGLKTSSEIIQKIKEILSTWTPF